MEMTDILFGFLVLASVVLLAIILDQYMKYLDGDRE